MKKENPTSIKEAFDNLNNAFREFCITAFEMDKIMERLSQIVKSANTPKTKHKQYQSPYAKFDKLRNRKHKKR